MLSLMRQCQKRRIHANFQGFWGIDGFAVVGSNGSESTSRRGDFYFDLIDIQMNPIKERRAKSNPEAGRR
jgi:hypothetical protein